MLVKRTFWRENWTPSTVAVNDFWRYYTFRLDQLPNIAEYQALFDQGRINAIKVTFRPRYDNFAGNDTTDTTLPGITNAAGCYMHTIVDPSSSIAPTGTYVSSNLNKFMENGNVRSRSGLKPFSVYFRPMSDFTVSGVAQARKRSPYVQLEGSSGIAVVHNGFHVFAQDVNLTGTQVQSFDVYVTYYLKFRNMK